MPSDNSCQHLTGDNLPVSAKHRNKCPFEVLFSVFMPLFAQKTDSGAQNSTTSILYDPPSTLDGCIWASRPTLPRCRLPDFPAPWHEMPSPVTVRTARSALPGSGPHPDDILVLRQAVPLKKIVPLNPLHLSDRPVRHTVSQIREFVPAIRTDGLCQREVAACPA